jgi:hypothetical protein
MNRNDDFDNTLESWLHRQAPPQAPDRVLDAALERVAAQSQKRTWLQRLIGETPLATMTRVAAVTAVIAIAAFIGFQLGNLSNDNDNVGNSPSPSASATPTVAAASATPEPTVVPSDANLVVQLHGPGEVGPLHLITILDNGVVISSEPELMERQLTAAGIQLVRDEMAATGLTDASANYDPVPNPGVEPPGYGGSGSVLEVGVPGGESVLITWYLFNDSPEQDFFQPQPEAEALEALSARLATLEEWLPASAWADATAAPYEPASYLMVIDTQPRGPGEDSWVEMDTVVWPLDEAIDDFGELSDPDIDGARSGCVSGADGRAVMAALDAAGASLYDSVNLTRTFVFGDGPSLLTVISVSANVFAAAPC